MLTNTIFPPFGSSYAPPATLFNATQYLNRGAQFTGAADSTLLLGSFWLNMATAVNGTDYRILANSGVYGDGFVVRRDASNKFTMQIGNPGGAGNCILINSARTIVAANGWVHVLFSYDNGRGTKFQLYINDAADAFADASAYGTADFTQPDTFFGNWAAAANFIGAISAFYWAPGQTLDLSVAGNRRKFVTAAVKPVNLGAAGATPTGTSPILFLNNPFGSFQTNLGTGGGMTLAAGTLASATGP